MGVAMKTIKQVADTLGVSRQAIYRRLSALPSEMVSTNNKGVQLINSDGEALLRTELSVILSGEPSANSTDSSPDSITDTLISMLKSELSAKNKLIDEQQQTIKELNETIKIQAQSINAAHHNELAETVIDGQKLLSSPAPDKVSLWNKIFKRKN